MFCAIDFRFIFDYTLIISKINRKSNNKLSTIMKIHLETIQDLAGFAAENVKSGNIAKILSRALLTSDDPEFYMYSE